MLWIQGRRKLEHDTWKIWKIMFLWLLKRSERLREIAHDLSNLDLACRCSSDPTLSRIHRSTLYNVGLERDGISGFNDNPFGQVSWHISWLSVH